MLLNALSFLAGVSLVQQLAVLPANTVLLAVCVLLVICLLIWILSARKPCFCGFQYSGFLTHFFQALSLFITGFLWTVLSAQIHLNHRLPEEMAGQDVHVEGIIVGIPDNRDKVQRFIFSVQQFKPAGLSANAILTAPKKLRLSWYHGNQVKAGERWRFLVRLKPPHGFLNPGGFDYEAWLFRQGIHATGYVRSSSNNRRLAVADDYSLDGVRHKLNTHIQNALAGRSHSGLVAALAVGSRSSISKKQWDTLIKTGTNHLVAISGLHIGLAAAFGYWLFRRLLPVSLMKRVPAQHFAVSGGLFVAFIYALLAGLSIPTQRALIMLVCFSGAWLLKKNFRPSLALASALLAILLWDPASVLSAGFWFSFLAVSVIYYVFSGRSAIGKESGRLWKQWGWMQIAITLVLFPASLFFFQQTSLISPLANLIMVPYVSFLVVPLILIALLAMPFSIVIADYLFIAAHNLLEIIWPLLNGLSTYKYAYWTATAPGLTEVMLATSGIVLILAPRGFPAKWLGILLICPLVISSTEKLPQGTFELNLLDVGQGLAAVVRTHNHVLIFDTGARFSARLNSGEAVIVPFLRRLSIRSIDKMIVSHGDSDHIGGAQSVLDVYPDTELIGQDINNLSALNRHSCVQGDSWSWDGVEFEFLHPDRQRAYKRRNNHSCVLRVSGKGGILLITGDIESLVEERLVSSNAEKLAADVLVVPHHGSKTSSTQQFIEAVQADTILFSAGYRNRYHHPNEGVVERYMKTGAHLYSSGHSGAIRVLFGPLMDAPVIDEYRDNHQKYWNHVVPKPWPKSWSNPDQGSSENPLVKAANQV